MRNICTVKMSFERFEYEILLFMKKQQKNTNIKNPMNAKEEKKIEIV